MSPKPCALRFEIEWIKFFKKSVWKGIVNFAVNFHYTRKTRKQPRSYIPRTLIRQAMDIAVVISPNNSLHHPLLLILLYYYVYYLLRLLRFLPLRCFSTALLHAGLPRSASCSFLPYEQLCGAGLHCPHGAAPSRSSVTRPACSQVSFAGILVNAVATKRTVEMWGSSCAGSWRRLSSPQRHSHVHGPTASLPRSPRQHGRSRGSVLPEPRPRPSSRPRPRPRRHGTDGKLQRPLWHEHSTFLRCRAGRLLGESPAIGAPGLTPHAHTDTRPDQIVFVGDFLNYVLLLVLPPPVVWKDWLLQ